MASIFTRIVKREIPAHIVAEDERCLAFLDINPLAKGHTLVIPKAEIDYYFDLDDELLSALTIFSKKVAHAIKQEIPCLRVGVCVVGLEIPHAHVHLIPWDKVHMRMRYLQSYYANTNAQARYFLFDGMRHLLGKNCER